MKLNSIKLFTIVLSLCSVSLSAQVTVQQLFQKPGVIGDSLSQGFYGVTVEKKTQDWAYPVLVSKQAGSNVSYNTLAGPYANLEDILKLNCGPICLASGIIGGNERDLSSEILSQCAQRVQIPTKPGSASLSIAAAGAAMLYELFGRAN